MIKDKEFREVPSFTIVQKRMRAVIPKFEIVKVQLDEAPEHYLFHLQLAKNNPLRLSKELLDDLPGKNNDHRNAQLDQAIGSLFARVN
jgi:hypothetical protein